MGRVKRIWYLSPMRAAKVQASLRIHAVSPEPSLLAHTSSESRGTSRQKARSQALLNGWACAVKICHDGMLEDTNSLDGAHLEFDNVLNFYYNLFNSIQGTITHLISVVKSSTGIAVFASTSGMMSSLLPPSGSAEPRADSTLNTRHCRHTNSSWKKSATSLSGSGFPWK